MMGSTSSDQPSSPSIHGLSLCFVGKPGLELELDLVDQLLTLQPRMHIRPANPEQLERLRRAILQMLEYFGGNKQQIGERDVFRLANLAYHVEQSVRFGPQDKAAVLSLVLELIKSKLPDDAHLLEPPSLLFRELWKWAHITGSDLLSPILIAPESPGRPYTPQGYLIEVILRRLTAYNAPANEIGDRLRALDYFRWLKQKTDKGEYVQLPKYYHAIGASSDGSGRGEEDFRAALMTGRLDVRTPRVGGPDGAWVSTVPMRQYGEYVFALSDEIEMYNDVLNAGERRRTNEGQLSKTPIRLLHDFFIQPFMQPIQLAPGRRKRASMIMIGGPAGASAAIVQDLRDADRTLELRNPPLADPRSEPTEYVSLLKFTSPRTGQEDYAIFSFDLVKVIAEACAWAQHHVLARKFTGLLHR